MRRLIDSDVPLSPLKCLFFDGCPSIMVLTHLPADKGLPPRKV